MKNFLVLAGLLVLGGCVWGKKESYWEEVCVKQELLYVQMLKIGQVMTYQPIYRCTKWETRCHMVNDLPCTPRIMAPANLGKFPEVEWDPRERNRRE